MMSFNKMVAVAALMVTISVQVEAQGGGRMGGGQRGAGAGAGGEQMQQMQQRARALMFKDITLSEEQTKKIDSITTATQAMRQEMMQAARGGGGDMQAMRTQVQTMQTDERKAMREVLTPEQQVQFDKNIEAMPAQGGARQRPPRLR